MYGIFQNRDEENSPVPMYKIISRFKALLQKDKKINHNFEVQSKRTNILISILL